MKWPAAGVLVALAGLAGCGSQYRPVINPVTKTGPPSQPTALVAVFSQPGLVSASTLPATAPPCPTDPTTGAITAYQSPGVVTVLNATGDSVAAQATLGNGPLGFALSPASSAFTLNCDGTISAMSISTELMSKDVTTSALLPGAAPINALVLNAGQYIVEQGRNAVAAMSSSTPPVLKVEISGFQPGLINLTGIATGQRIYAISQGVPYGTCSNPASVTTDGEADGIEVTNNSISSRIPVGVCPVFGVTSADGLRSFILNRGSGTITVINTQSNSLDTVNASSYVTNGTITLPCAPGVTSCTPGPVDADFYSPGNLLVVANYDDDTVSVIDTSLDVYGNDGATFGKVLATIPVGHHPAGVTVLQDGSRAYVANEDDGSISVVSLTSFTVLKTIQLAPVPAPTQANPSNTVLPQPRSIASNYNYPAGNVFVGAQNSPYVTVIRTDNDTVSAQTLVQGDVVDLQTSTQYAGQTTRNAETDSRSVGSGMP